MYRLLYNTVIIPLAYGLLTLLSSFSKKINKFLKVRRNLFKNLERQKIRLNPYKKTILFHCSSFGEYKQTLPLIKRFRQISDRYNIILTFYSPSAGENLKDIPLVEVLTYMPLDTMMQMKKFIGMLKPDLVVISKHDLWPNFLYELKSRSIPVYLVNALLPADSLFLKPLIKNLVKPYFNLLTGIITIDEINKKRFSKIFKNKNKIHIFGDSRFDIVIDEAKKNKDLKLHGCFSISDKNFVAGSCWPNGEKIILAAWNKIKHAIPNAFLTLVPHEINADHIYKIESYCQENNLNSIVYSDYLEEDSHDLDLYDVLIVDKIGMLVEIYSSASISYVGGGFGKAGLHSVLEPAAYGIPVLFGYNLSRSPEANEMKKRKCGQVFYGINDFYKEVIKLWKDDDYYNTICNKTLDYINEKSGATELIYLLLSEELYETQVTVSESFTNTELERLLKENIEDDDL